MKKKATATMKEKKRRPTRDVRSLRSTFARRGKGLLKKAYELSTLVGVDVCVILLPPLGEDGSSSSSLPSPPLTWPEQPSDLLRIIHRFQRVGHREQHNHQNSSSASLSPSPLLTWPEEHSELLPIIDRFKSICNKGKNPHSPPLSFLLEENHRLKQEQQQVRRQNLELVAPAPNCDSTGTKQAVEPSSCDSTGSKKDTKPLMDLESVFDDIDQTISEMQSTAEDKEFLEFFESLTQAEGENKPTATHQGDRVMDICQPLLLDDLPPSPMTWSSSAFWDFPVLQESPLHCSSQFQSSLLEDEISFFSAAFGDSNALPIF